MNRRTEIEDDIRKLHRYRATILRFRRSQLEYELLGKICYFLIIELHTIKYEREA